MGNGCSQDDIDIAILTATLKGTYFVYWPLIKFTSHQVTNDHTFAGVID